MDRENRQPLDYYLLPRIDISAQKHLVLREQNGVYLDAYRFGTLEFFFGMVRRVQALEAL
jgi:hypothetical protein